MVLLLGLGAYFVGSIPFGLLVARARGTDIRSAGSGNIGATNVGRVLGRKWGLFVFALDFLKGAGPAAAGLAIAETDGGVVAGLAAFLGHLFPVWLRFKGGKGVATGAGVVVVLTPAPAAAALLMWLVVTSASRNVALGSVAGVAALVAVHLERTPAPFDRTALPLTAFCLAGCALVVARHRGNLRRAWLGTEHLLKESPLMRSVATTLHVLALALWFGSAAFFSLLAAPTVFRTFTEFVTDKPADVPLRDDYDKSQASRLAGAVVGPIFPQFFRLQFACGIIATITAASWQTLGRVHRWRFTLCLLALILVGVGWPLSVHVAELRTHREESEAGRQAFANWHLVSLGLQVGTILVVAAAAALAARLPQPIPAKE